MNAFKCYFLYVFPIAKFYNSLWIKLFSNLFPDNWLEKVQRSFQQCSKFINQISHPFLHANTKFIYDLCLVFVISFFHPFTTTKYWNLFISPCICFPNKIALSFSEYISLWLHAQFYLKPKDSNYPSFNLSLHISQI